MVVFVGAFLVVGFLAGLVSYLASNLYSLCDSSTFGLSWSWTFVVLVLVVLPLAGTGLALVETGLALVETGLALVDTGLALVETVFPLAGVFLVGLSISCSLLLSSILS